MAIGYKLTVTADKRRTVFSLTVLETATDNSETFSDLSRKDVERRLRQYDNKNAALKAPNDLYNRFYLILRR